MNKKTLLFGLILIITVTASSWYAIRAAHTIVNQPQSIAKTEAPDFYMTEIVDQDFNELGNIHNQIIAAKVTHFAANNSFVFEHPHMLMFETANESWVIDADQGKSAHGKETILLSGNVKLNQTIKQKPQGFVITTNQLTLYPSSKKAHTDQAVTIIESQSVMQAVGANADFNARTLQLLSKVKGQYKKSN